MYVEKGELNLVSESIYGDKFFKQDFVRLQSLCKNLRKASGII